MIEIAKTGDGFDSLHVWPACWGSKSESTQVSDTKIGSIYRSYESTISRTLPPGWYRWDGGSGGTGGTGNIQLLER